MAFPPPAFPPSKTPDWLNGLEHAIFTPQSWAVEHLHERMIKAAQEAPESDRAQDYGQLIAINQQFRLLLVYQKQWEPAPAVVHAYEQVYAMTRSMAQALDLRVDGMDDYLLGVAIETDCGWALDFLVPRCRHLLNTRENMDALNAGGWPLTRAASLHGFDTLHRLMKHGATWDPDGKRVLTELPCDHPDHPLIGQDRNTGRPWWTVLYNDRRSWTALTRDLVREEFDARWGEDLAKARERFEGSPEAWVLDLVKTFSIGVAHQAERFREPTFDAIDLPEHQRPSREVMIAELFLNHRQRQTPESSQAIASLGLTPTPAEQEAILTLRIRAGDPLSDLPDTWLPTVHQGKALWALLEASAWNEEKQCWNGYGQRLMVHANALQDLADVAGVHPAKVWMNEHLERTRAGHFYVEENVKERIINVQKHLAPLIAGLDRMETIFAGPAIDRETWRAPMKAWIDKQMVREQDSPRLKEEQALRAVDLDVWLDTWIARQPAPVRDPWVRPRL